MEKSKRMKKHFFFIVKLQTPNGFWTHNITLHLTPTSRWGVLELKLIGRTRKQFFKEGKKQKNHTQHAVESLGVFFKTLSDWMSIIGSHYIFLVYDLMDACNLCIWLFWSPAVYLGDSFLWLWIKKNLLVKKKKKTNNTVESFC